MVKSIIVVLVILLIGGCGTNTATSPSSATSATTVKTDSKEKGYIYKSSNEAMFITWTEDSNKKIVGQLQITDLTNTGIQSTNHAINGVINGSNISITITGSIWNDGAAGKVFTGTLNGNSQLTLLLPASNGTLTSIPFTSGNANDFNNLVTTFNNTYTAEQNAAQEAVQQQVLQEKRQKITQNLTSSYNALQQDMNNLPDYDFSKDLESMQKDYTNMQSDNNKLQQDASVVPLTNQQLNVTVQQDLNVGMQQDLNVTLQQDLNVTITQDIRSLNNAIATVNSDISDVQTNYQAYKGNGIAGSFTDQSITNIITKAQNEMKAANDKVTSTQKQANDIYNQGQQLFQTAQKYFSSLQSSE